MTLARAFQMCTVVAKEKNIAKGMQFLVEGQSFVFCGDSDVMQKGKIGINNMLMTPLKDIIVLWCIARCFVVLNTMSKKKIDKNNEFSSTIRVKDLISRLNYFLMRDLKVFKSNQHIKFDLQRIKPRDLCKLTNKNDIIEKTIIRLNQ